jgi:hypothetical protein
VDRIADEKEERKLVILAAHRKGRREERDTRWCLCLVFVPLTLHFPFILFFSSRKYCIYPPSKKHLTVLLFVK